MSTVPEPTYQELVDYVAGCGRGVLETRQALLAQQDRLQTQVGRHQMEAAEAALLLKSELAAIITELKALSDTKLPKTSGDLAEKINSVVQRVGAVEGRIQNTLSQSQEQIRILLVGERRHTTDLVGKLEGQVIRNLEALQANLRTQHEAVSAALKQADSRMTRVVAQQSDNQQYVRFMADADETRHKEIQKRLGRVMFVLILCLIGVWYKVWVQ